MVPGDFQELQHNNTEMLHEILVRHISYFGPLPEGLLQQVDDKVWCSILQAASRIAEEVINDDPNMRFEQWPEELAPNLTPGAKSMISKMMNLDPAARATINDVLENPWW